MDDELEFSIRPTTMGNQLFDQVRNFFNLFACFVGVASSYGALGCCRAVNALLSLAS